MNFSKNQTAGQHIEYYFYVEGVLVPLQYFTIGNAVGQPVIMKANVAPFPEAITCLKKGMKVFLFKRVNGEKDSRLRFFGYITGHHYSKNFGSRSLTLECASVNYMWQRMLSHTLDIKDLTGSAYSNKLIYNTVSNNATISKLQNDLAKYKQEKDTATDESAKQNASIEYNKTKALIDAATKVKSDYDTFVQSGIGMSKSLGSALAGGINEITSPTNVILNTAVEKGANVVSTRDAMLRDAAIGKPVKATLSMSTIFDTYFKESGNYMTALFNTIEAAHLKSDPYTCREFQTLKEYYFMAYLPVFDPDLTSEKSSDTSEIPTTDTMSSKTLYSYIRSTITSAIKQAAGGAPLITTLLSVLDSLFIKISVDPLAVQKSIIFHPLMLSFIPPRCNVLFPNMYERLDITVDDWQEPTRSFVMLPPSASKIKVIADSSVQAGSNGAFSQTRCILCDSNDKYLRIANIENSRMGKISSEIPNASSNNSISQSLISSYKTIMDIVTEEEQETGIALNVTSLPHQFMSNAAPEYVVNLADFVHNLAKYSIRSCSVSGCLIDDMVVGMPILILDGRYSIHGILESVQYNVSSDGAYNSTLQISYPKFVFLGDEIMAPPLWLKCGNKGRIENIDAAYKEFFGCPSIYDENVKEASDTTLSDTNRLMYLTADLLNKFNAESERWKFVEDYRKRNELTQKQVMEEIYECKPDSTASTKQDDRVLEYHEGIFAPYNLSEYQSPEARSSMSSSGLSLPKVDKQGKVKVYLNDIYKQTTGVTAGVLANDCDLDTTDIFKVNIIRES